MMRRRSILSSLLWLSLSSVVDSLAPLLSRRQSLQAAAAATMAAATVTQSLPASATSPPPAADLRTGVPAPAFTLPNNKDSTTSLASLVQDTSIDWIVLYFYPGAFSPGCTLEAQRFQKDLAKYQSLYKAQIVGVSVDPPAKQNDFCSSEGLQFPLLSDAGGRVSQLYGSTVSIPGFGTFSNRQTYLIDGKNGTVRWVFKDVENRIPQHSEEVLEKLSELTGVAVS